MLFGQRMWSTSGSVYVRDPPTISYHNEAETKSISFIQTFFWGTNRNFNNVHICAKIVGICFHSSFLLAFHACFTFTTWRNAVVYMFANFLVILVIYVSVCVQSHVLDKMLQPPGALFHRNRLKHWALAHKHTPFEMEPYCGNLKQNYLTV